MHHARETLRREGYRLTPQRTLIWEVVRGAGRHMTAEEIAAEVKARLPDVNLSTVYRTMDLLVRLGLVTETRLGATRTYFEVAPEPHHHIVCESCGAVGHFPDKRFAGLYETLAEEEGFTATRTRATVFGVCADCRDEPVEGAAGKEPGNHAHP